MEVIDPIKDRRLEIRATLVNQGRIGKSGYAELPNAFNCMPSIACTYPGQIDAFELSGKQIIWR